MSDHELTELQRLIAEVGSPLYVSREQREKNAATRVVVGMSGGVDSSVTALILKAQGFSVLGLFMKNWDEADGPDKVCTAEEDYGDVRRVCDRIGIPYYSIQFVQEYWDHVFKDFLKDYEAGFTPNPDILCNREIKFNIFFKKALEMGADFLATGHYARRLVNPQTQVAELYKGLDANKDQSYFVYTLNKKILSQVLFPIGDLEKPLVRRLAADAGLSTAAKKDSTGICFIGERKFREFLGKYVHSKPGYFLHLNGERVGQHQGVAFYTLGQRKGLRLGGEGAPWFVVKKDPVKNFVYVERGEEHPALYCDELICGELSWVSGGPPVSEWPLQCRAKVRYRQVDQACTVISESVDAEGAATLRVVFDHPQRAVTPGQAIVFYDQRKDGVICLGGARILSHGPTYFERGLTPILYKSNEPKNSEID